MKELMLNCLQAHHFRENQAIEKALQNNVFMKNLKEYHITVRKYRERITKI